MGRRVLFHIGGMIPCVLLFATTSLSLELDPAEIRGTPKNKPVSVLQQRFFTKSLRPEIGVLAGTFLNEAYTDTAAYGVRGALFFSEWVGVELQFARTSVSDSDDRKALNTLQYHRKDYEGGTENSELVTPDAEINPIHEILDTNIIAAPFYGKLNLMDKLIVYSDLYFTTGLARVNTDQGTLNGLSIGVGQRFYLLNSLSFRVDFRNRIYNEQRAGESSRKNSLSVDFGASYFFL